MRVRTTNRCVVASTAAAESRASSPPEQASGYHFAIASYEVEVNGGDPEVVYTLPDGTVSGDKVSGLGPISEVRTIDGQNSWAQNLGPYEQNTTVAIRVRASTVVGWGEWGERAELAE